VARAGDVTQLQADLRKRRDKALRPGFDSHFACVSMKSKYQAVGVEDEDFDELVVKEEAQVLPVAVVYFEKGSGDW